MKRSLGQICAEIERLPLFLDRKKAVEALPVEIQAQVVSHLKTVKALKARARARSGG